MRTHRGSMILPYSMFETLLESQGFKDPVVTGLMARPVMRDVVLAFSSPTSEEVPDNVEPPLTDPPTFSIEHRYLPDGMAGMTIHEDGTTEHFSKPQTRQTRLVSGWNMGS